MITPCVAVCKIDETSNVCIGCKRTSEEIIDWHAYTSEQRLSIMRRLGYGKRVGREERLRNYDRG